MNYSLSVIKILSAYSIYACISNFVCAAESPKIIQRTEWGAKDPKSDISKYQDYGLNKPVYTKIILHSTAMGYGVGSQEAKRIQNKEMNEMGFSDIGYNFLIDSNGTIFEGRQLWYVPLWNQALHDLYLQKNFF